MLSIILESIGMTATVRAKRYSGAGRHDSAGSPRASLTLD
ncbi:hypothetical protein BBB_1094 [Bifidobacterium bifidum BGN4]|uniref:Uncharacterized protein n=1 Tax=Bifidobacterium bifidum BGN4 TaxID=484020 RepID=I3WIH3_BIFBI|nr:hypothetical protein BBB_1094 [Bifidobacterium bifidum BGN4]ERI83764.1 hypothetical protein BIFBIF_00501 [Bifidobacterium bifidum ATCC 29521 = JCM 1255 = DSM 20456]BBA55389.1 hypothetical protein BBTM_00729 [Bifidobacterium bifidum]